MRRQQNVTSRIAIVGGAERALASFAGAIDHTNTAIAHEVAEASSSVYDSETVFTSSVRVRIKDIAPSRLVNSFKCHLVCHGPMRI